MHHIQNLRRITEPYNLNTYFLVCKESRKGVIIDLGGRVEDIADFIRETDMIPDKILKWGDKNIFSSSQMDRQPMCPKPIHL